MFGSRAKKRALRIFFATDVHGSDRCFRKFLAAAESYDADTLILGGDIAGKGLVPISSHNGTLSAEIRGQEVTVPRAEEEDLRAEINRLGFYSMMASKEDLERMAADSHFVDTAFRNAITDQIRAWCRLTEERLAPRVRCLITPGNDDPLSIDPVLKSEPRIECPERELCEIGPVLVASCGDVTPTPWNTEREFSEEELGLRLSAILDPAPPGSHVVVNFHCPPYGSSLDYAAELDDELRPVIRGGRPSIIPVGSVAVRDVIKKYEPVVGLHGHIHESRGAQKIGRTMCLNPGSDYSADLLRGAIVDFAADGSYIDFLLTSG
jgi:Icc-related predicted phosphoesterase